MDAFDRADAMVQLWGGLLGVAVMAFFAYRMFFGRKKASSDRRKPGNAATEVREPVSGDAVPGSLDGAGSQPQSLPQAQKRTVSGFAKWWLIFWIVANTGGALAPAGSLTNSAIAGLAAIVMLLSAAIAAGYYLLLTRKPAGLYLILAANTLGAFLNGVAVPGYSVMITTGLIPAILTYFITRKQVPYPFGRSAPSLENQSGATDAAPVPLDAALPPADEPVALAATTPVDTRTAAGQPSRKSRLPLAFALLGVVLLIAVVAAFSIIGGRRAAPSADVAPTATAAPMRLAAAATPTRTRPASPTTRPTPTAMPTLAPTIEVVSPVTLADALDGQLADIRILGMGGASGASIQIIARATGSRSVSIEIAPGTVLRSSVPGEQDMVVRQLLGLRQGEQRYIPADVIFLHAPAAEPVTYIVDAYCLNFHKDNPSATTVFSVDADALASPDVAAVLAAAGRVPGAAQDIAAIQAAVWTVTDRPTWQELASRGYSPDRQMVAALLQSAGLDQACAQLLGQACTVPDCPMNPTGMGGTTGGPCVKRLPGVTLPAPTAAHPERNAAQPKGTATATTHPERNAAQPKGRPATATGGTTSVLDAQLKKLFAPGPDTAGIAITGDAIWVADGEQKRIHRLDRSGAPIGSFQVKAQGEYRGLAWDGEALRLLVYDYKLGSQVLRLDAQGEILSIFTVPADLHALAWDEGDSSLWTIAPGSDGFLLEFGAGGELRQTLQVPVFGSLEGLALAPDGLWVLSGFGKWYRFSLEGEYLASAELPMEVFAKDPALAWTDEGALWVSVADTREIYQFALRRAAVDAELPSELRSSSQARSTGELPLPEPVFRALPEDTYAVARAANGLSAPLIVSLDSLSGGDVHESAVIAPGDTWSATIAKGGAFTLFATANAAEPVAFYDKVLLLAGYEYTWIIGDAAAVAPPPTAAPATANPERSAAQPKGTAIPPTVAPTARSVAPPAAAPTRAPTRSAPAAAPAAVCPDARARITYPANGAAISGVTNFLGTANVPDQAYYKFEYKPASSPTWQYLTQVDGKTVIGDKLMDFFTTTIAPGVYDFRLIVVDRSGNYPSPCEIRLTVRR